MSCDYGELLHKISINCGLSLSKVSDALDIAISTSSSYESGTPLLILIKLLDY